MLTVHWARNWHSIAPVIVDRRAPEVRAHHTVNKFSAHVTVRCDSAPAAVKQHLKMIPPHTEIVRAVRDK